MPSRISAELSQLARLARDGGLDLSQVSLRVKTDLLLTTPRPSAGDLAAFGDLATALIPGVDEANAVILARKLAGWRHTPAPVLAALRARGGEVEACLLRHGLPLSQAEIEALAEGDDPQLAAALAGRPDLTPAATSLLAARDDRSIDLALIGNAAIPLPREALDLLIARAPGEAAYAQGLLARSDLSHLDLAPLFLQAGAERRLAMLDSLASVEALAPSERRAPVAPEIFAGWLAMAGDDHDGVFGAITAHLGGGETLAMAMQADHSRDLTALALIAAGVTPEDATRFLIRLGDETAHSVERIFALVALMRSVRPTVAWRAVLQIAGETARPAARRGQHLPAMDPSGTPERASPARATGLGELLDRVGLRRERG